MKDITNMSIINQHFNNETWAQFLTTSSKTFQSDTKQSNCKNGTLVLLQNLETKQILGIAQLGAFTEGETLRERFLLNEDTYKGESSRFNRKYEIAIAKVITIKPISFEDFAFLFDIDNKLKNNITKGTPFENRKLFYKSEEEGAEGKILKKLSIWAESLLGTK